MLFNSNILWHDLKHWQSFGDPGRVTNNKDTEVETKDLVLKDEYFLNYEITRWEKDKERHLSRLFRMIEAYKRIKLFGTRDEIFCLLRAIEYVKLFAAKYMDGEIEWMDTLCKEMEEFPELVDIFKIDWDIVDDPIVKIYVTWFNIDPEDQKLQLKIQELQNIFSE